MSQDDPSSPLLPSTLQLSHSEDFHETDSLLPRADTTRRYNASHQYEQDEGTISSPAARTLGSIQAALNRAKKKPFRWMMFRLPSLIAIIFIGFLLIAIMLFGFIAPNLIETYTKEALSVEPTKLSIDSFTASGIKARIQADFRVDASRVSNMHIRNIGKIGSWIVKEVESQESKVKIFLPDYGNKLIGTATIPGLIVDIRNNRKTSLDLVVNLTIEDLDEVRRLTNHWLEGDLDRIRVLTKADMSIKSGLVSFGSQSISKFIVFEVSDHLMTPLYHINSINVRETLTPGLEGHSLAANASLFIENVYPVDFNLPALQFEVLAPGCSPGDLIGITYVSTGLTHIYPHSGGIVSINGTIREMPKSLIEHCPESIYSPLDMLLSDYSHGKNITVFVRGSDTSNYDENNWVFKIISNITLPIILPPHQFGSLVRNFSLTDTELSLPDPFSEPGSDEADPHISGRIIAIADIPKGMNFTIDVDKVRAHVNVLYKGSKFGEIPLYKWQETQSERIQRPNNHGIFLEVQSVVKNAPLKIIDGNVFSEVINVLLIEKQAILLEIEALIDAQVATVLGQFLINDIPTNGTIPVKL